MRALLILSILGTALLAVACSPHHGWHHAGFRDGNSGYWNSQASEPYPVQQRGVPWHDTAPPYSKTGN